MMVSRSTVRGHVPSKQQPVAASLAVVKVYVKGRAQAGCSAGEEVPPANAEVVHSVVQ